MKLQITDIARLTESKVAKIELAEIRLQTYFRLIESEIVEIQCFVDAIFLFVVVVALIVLLIDFCVDALIASIIDVSAVDASMTVTMIRVFDAVMPRNLMLTKN